MYQHFILIASSYTAGTRIGFHLSSKNQIQKSIIEDKMERISQLKREDIGVHSLITDSPAWESVIQLDSFFEDIVICQSFEKFEEALTFDSKITAIDIAKFFLTVKPMSHLKIQKLVYLAYKEYLLKYNQSLFEEKIVAYKYGPVVEEVYQTFKKYGAGAIKMEDSTEYILKDIHFPQAMGRMLLANDVEKIVPVLLEIVEKYGDFEAGQLIDLTHSKKGPWYTVYKPQLNCEITDEVILSQAKYETISLY
ncbi:Panacea domain-containing protein [Lactococcus petauri]|uniref:Panacea domain-containing protein n=1 Tax=Lactococcus petauri TaxID=1940789 RepID=UPI001F56F90A|nr:type II toxin-antitoxin system antitoxin SocA domain-containing protein [Lactococcus petauri]